MKDEITCKTSNWIGLLPFHRETMKRPVWNMNGLIHSGQHLFAFVCITLLHISLPFLFSQSLSLGLTVRHLYTKWNSTFLLFLTSLSLFFRFAWTTHYIHANCSADTLLETGSNIQIYSLISTPPLSLSCVVSRFSWTLFQAEDIQTFRSYFSLLVKRADDDDNIITHLSPSLSTYRSSDFTTNCIH